MEKIEEGKKDRQTHLTKAEMCSQGQSVVKLYLPLLVDGLRSV